MVSLEVYRFIQSRSVKLCDPWKVYFGRRIRSHPCTSSTRYDADYNALKNLLTKGLPEFSWWSRFAIRHRESGAEK